jgi:hypothetical protein
MATITGSKYSGSISSYSESSRQLTITGTSFVSSDFNTSRMVVAYNSSNQFLGLAIVRRFINSTMLELESNFFDPITQSEVTVTTGSFEVSNTLVESGGWTASGLSLTQTSAHNIGTSGDEKSACIYDEGKIISANQLSYFGGVVLLGRPSRQGKSFTNPCTLRYTSGGTKMVTRSTDAHFFMFGGSLAVQSTPVYFGGYQGRAGGSYLFHEVNAQSADLISVGAGGSWGANTDRHVLRNIKTLASSNNAISVRWGDGVISGGQYQLIGSTALSIFGTDTQGTYNISAPAGSRLIAEEIGLGGKPALFRSNQASNLTLNYDNVVSSNRRFSSGGGSTNPNGLGIFTYTDAYSNALAGTKLVIVDSSGAVVDSGTSNGVDPLELTVEEARVQGATETVTESGWGFFAYLYGTNLVANSFSTTTQATIGGDAKNVVHGSVLLQSIDTSISETKATVDAYTEIDTSAKFYDRASAYLEDNFGTYLDFVVNRSGSLIDAGAYNVTIDATASTAFDITGNLITIKASIFTGDMTTTGVITLANGVSFNGTRTDANGTVSPNSVLTLTGLQANSEVRVYIAGTTTEIAGVENSGTTFVDATIAVNSVDIVIHNVQYEYQKIEAADTSSNLTLPIQQRFDRNYSNV